MPLSCVFLFREITQETSFANSILVTLTIGRLRLAADGVRYAECYFC